MNNEEFLTAVEKRWASDIQNQSSGGCPEAEQILELAERGKRAKNHDLLMNHVAQCAACLKTYKQLRYAETLVRQSRVRPAWFRQPLFQRLLAPVAVALIISLYFTFKSFFPVTVETVVEPPKEESPLNKSPEQPAPRQEFPRVTDQPKPAPPRPEERKRPERLRPQEHRTHYASNVWLEKGALYEGGQRLPDWSSNYLNPLREDPPVYRSGGEQASSVFEMIEPDMRNAALEQVNPVFRWNPVEGVAGYEVTLEQRGASGNYRSLANPLSVEDSIARLPTGERLQRGASYRLQVKLLTEDPLDPLSDLPPFVFTFRVLTAREVQHLAWARRNVRKMPIASAMTLYHLGFYSEALKAMPTTSSDPRIQVWRKAMEQRLLQNN